MDQSLGRDLCHVVAWRISERSADQQDPTGAPWPANERRYARRKAAHYGWPEDDATNYRTGQMLSHLSLLGQPDVQETEILMRYGTGQAPGVSTWSPEDHRTPGERAADSAVTDQQKAMWAHEKNRGFYEADSVMRDRVIEAAGDALATYLREVQ